MVEKFGLRRGDAFEAALAAVLESAAAQLTVDTADEICRAAKAVAALVAAKRALAELSASASTGVEEDDDDIRAELRRRVARFVEADLAGAPAEALERIATQDAPR
jgi:antitoxin (DNA-binding transcriptional repressor) of toxin-antitoxin stability system